MTLTKPMKPENNAPTKEPKKFAILYFPGALMLPRSMNKIRALLKHALFPNDIETLTWQYNPFQDKEAALDDLLSLARDIPDFDERRLVLVGESYGLDLATEFRARHGLDALVIGSSPSPSLVHPLIEQQRASIPLDRQFYWSLFNNDAGRALIQNWFKWNDREYIHPSPYVSEENMIIFSGVKIDNPSPRQQSRLNKDHIEQLHKYPNIMAINIDGEGHRVMLTSAAFVAFSCRMYILRPDIKPCGHLKLPDIRDESLYHPLHGEIVQ